MTNHPVLLDCTLRDGGNQNDWHFTPRDVDTIVRGLDDALIDVIEVGYRGGSGSKNTDAAGPSARCSPDYLAALPEVRHAELAVMVVPTVCPIEQLDDLPDSPVSMVRIAAYPWDVDGVAPYVARARQLGLRTTVNLMALSYLDRDGLEQVCATLRQELPDVMYVADSFGALNPDDITERVALLREELGVPVGAHCHNNLGLAATNAVAALEAGAGWLDASLGAMARGAGNLATEQAVAFLAAWPRYSTHARLPEVCDVSEYVAEHVLPRPMTVRRAEIAAGINDHHYYYQDRLEKAAGQRGIDAWELGRRIGAARPHGVSDDIIQTAADELSTSTEGRSA